MDDCDLDGINYFILSNIFSRDMPVLLISQALDAVKSVNERNATKFRNSCKRKFGQRLKFSLNFSRDFAVIYSFRYVLVRAQTAQST